MLNGSVSKQYSESILCHANKRIGVSKLKEKKSISNPQEITGACNGAQEHVQSE
jgi:hypothetical protein